MVPIYLGLFLCWSTQALNTLLVTGQNTVSLWHESQPAPAVVFQWSISLSMHQINFTYTTGNLQRRRRMQHNIMDERAIGSEGNAGCCRERRHRSIFRWQRKWSPRLNSIIKHLQIVPCAHLKSSHHSMSLIGGITPKWTPNCYTPAALKETDNSSMQGWWKPLNCMNPKDLRSFCRDYLWLRRYKVAIGNHRSITLFHKASNS